jgi:hypothetical protein
LKIKKKSWDLTGFSSCCLIPFFAKIISRDSYWMCYWHAMWEWVWKRRKTPKKDIGKCNSTLNKVSLSSWWRCNSFECFLKYTSKGNPELDSFSYCVWFIQLNQDFLFSFLCWMMSCLLGRDF